MLVAMQSRTPEPTTSAPTTGGPRTAQPVRELALRTAASFLGRLIYKAVTMLWEVVGG